MSQTIVITGTASGFGRSSGSGSHLRVQFGQVDALVNDADYYHTGPVEAGTMQQVHEQFQTKDGVRL